MHTGYRRGSVRVINRKNAERHRIAGRQMQPKYCVQYVCILL
jgi:hypothetical protein